MTKPLLKSPEQVKAEFIANGISISEWCRANGFNRYVVHDLLRRKRIGRRGEAHRAAVALGMKRDPSRGRKR